MIDNNDMADRKIVVGITQGDANGIGYEVTIKALADSRALDMFTPVVYGSAKAFSFYRKGLHDIDQVETYTIGSAQEAKPRRINLVNCVSDSFFVEPGQMTKASAESAIASLAKAVEDLRSGNIDVLVTAPINKQAMASGGFRFPGHTEYLADAFGGAEVEMMLVSEGLRVGVVTGHIPLKDVPGTISEELILKKLRLMSASLRRDFGIDRPKIAVLGLNPHCSDGGVIGSEENEIIIPALRKAAEEGIDAFGPYPADGLFGSDAAAGFDAVLAMYHDQGLAPFKALAFSTGVNFTAGLPAVRTSPDHGTAFGISGKDMADPSSMRAAINLAIDIFRKRKAFDALQAGKLDIKPTEPDRSRWQ